MLNFTTWLCRRSWLRDLFVWGKLFVIGKEEKRKGEREGVGEDGGGGRGGVGEEEKEGEGE